MTAQLNDIQREIIPDEDPDASWLEQDEFEDRLAAYRRGEFSLVGVRAVAHILIPIGTAWIVQTITSPGLWGIESDSDDAHFDEMFEEEKSTLLDMLRELHVQL